MRCSRRKMGEYNPLRCVAEEGHQGDCVFVVDGQYKEHQIMKPKTKHTPGPWIMLNEDKPYGAAWVGTPPKKNEHKLNSLIAEVYGTNTKDIETFEAEREANARLISKAWLLPEVKSVLRDAIVDGRLQTFEDRERFRTQAKQLLAKLTE